MRYFGFVLILAFCCEAKYVPENGIYSVADKMPVYSDGMQNLEKHIAKEIAQLDNSVPGSVFVSFVVTFEGKIEQVKVVKSINTSQDNLACNALRNAPSKWNPGMSEGKPVSVKMTYPVRFK
jgi:protein TonB